MVTRLQELTGVALAFSRRETILEGMTSSSLAAVAHDAVGPPIPFDNSYARLPEAFYERVRPQRSFRRHVRRRQNVSWEHGADTIPQLVCTRMALGRGEALSGS